MENTLVNVYDTLEAAEQMRQSLLAGGFTDIHLTLPDDEAGPVQGNFTVGDHVEPGSRSSSNDEYENKFATAIQRGMFVLIVHADSDRIARAAEILGRSGPQP